jgi:predicted transcriptional regulator
MPKKVLVALPPGLLEQVDSVALCEHRTRSDLIREALRRYIDGFRRGEAVKQAAARGGVVDLRTGKRPVVIEDVAEPPVEREIVPHGLSDVVSMSIIEDDLSFRELARHSHYEK